MYDTPNFFLVDNPIDRYSIGDRMQHHEPAGPQEKANWLPTPEGPFRPILRSYEPDDAILDGSYELPPITRTN